MDNSKVPIDAYLAYDLGAESGRAIIGYLESDKLVIREIHRFPNRAFRVSESLFWDAAYLWNEMKHGLSLAMKEKDIVIISLGIDTWGVDFALLDEKDRLLENPYSYRDSRTVGMVEEAGKLIPLFEIFQQTGNQIMPINSLFQLFAMKQAGSCRLAQACTFMTIPDLFNFWFSGKKVSELTIAATTQCFDLNNNEWARELLAKMGIPTAFFPPVVPPGTILGELAGEQAGEFKGKNLKIVAVASHDTQSANLAVPSKSDNHLYISSGTWSLMGIETDQPLINQAVYENGLTNEGGYDGRYNLLKNITGLWILQECRRNWTEEGNSFTYNELTDLASQMDPFYALIDPEDPIFLAPGDMVSRIKSFCEKTDQFIPESPGAITRCILESLALEYRNVFEKITSLTGQSYPVIHIIGGGSRNRLLNQFTANATGKTVIAGPVEASAIGNILVQAISTGKIKSISEAREIVRTSFDVVEYYPESIEDWDAAYLRYRHLSTAV